MNPSSSEVTRSSLMPPPSSYNPDVDMTLKEIDNFAQHLQLMEFETNMEKMLTSGVG
jgi:hypothetical protein